MALAIVPAQLQGPASRLDRIATGKHTGDPSQLSLAAPESPPDANQRNAVPTADKAIGDQSRSFTIVRLEAKMSTRGYLAIVDHAVEFSM